MFSRIWVWCRSRRAGLLLGTFLVATVVLAEAFALSQYLWTDAPAKPDLVMFWLWTAIIGVLAIGVVARSLHMIGPDQRLVSILLGNPWVAYVNPSDREGYQKGARKGLMGTGYVFLLWPFFSVRRAPTLQLRLDFKADKVLTKPGTDLPKPKRKTKKSKKPAGGLPVDQAELVVDTTLYLRWGTGEDLLRTVRVLPTALDDIEGLKGFYSDAVVDAVRKIAGNNVWSELIRDRNGFELGVREELRDPESPFVQTGLLPPRRERGVPPPPKGELPSHAIDLAIVNVAFKDAKLAEQFNAPQAARFELEAARRKAEGAAYQEKEVGMARVSVLDQEYAVRQARDPHGLYSAAEAWKQATGSTNLGIISDTDRGILGGIAAALGSTLGSGQKGQGKQGP